MRNRNRQVLLWLTEKELLKLNNKVEKAGISRQEYFMQLINNLSPIECPKPDTSEVRELIAADGAEFNEIAHQLNAEGTINTGRYSDAANKLYKHMMILEQMIRDEIARIYKIDEEQSGQ